MSRTLIIDIGNTATEIAVFENEKKIDFIGFFKLPDDKVKLNSALAEYKKNHALPESGMIFSVAPDFVKVVQKLVKKNFKISVSVFDWKSYVLANKNKKITEPIGADLLADIKACEKYYGGPALIVDCGTITKLLLLDKTSKFVGISMTPGLETMIKTFYEHTAHLPNVELEKPKEEVSTNTYGSMCHGSYWSTVSYIKDMFNKVNLENKKLVITGGNLRFIKDEFPGAKIDQFLTLKGMYLLYKEVSK